MTTETSGEAERAFLQNPKLGDRRSFMAGWDAALEWAAAHQEERIAAERQREADIRMLAVEAIREGRPEVADSILTYISSEEPSDAVMERVRQLAEERGW